MWVLNLVGISSEDLRPGFRFIIAGTGDVVEAGTVMFPGTDYEYDLRRRDYFQGFYEAEFRYLERDDIFLHDDLGRLFRARNEEKGGNQHTNQ
jgi:hypothetical protein